MTTGPVRPLISLLGAAALVIAGCAPGPTMTASTVPRTLVPTPSKPADTGARLAVDFGGTIHCASMQYGCGPTLSILPADAPLTDDWRPPATDPWWAPDYTSPRYDTFDPTPSTPLPLVPIGRHELVITLLGSSDVPSYNPDGSRALDLLGRCVSDVVVGPTTGLVHVLVTFTPDSASFRASCTLDVKLT